MKLCECGCGKTAPIATMTSRDRGWIKGEQKRFIRFHQIRTKKHRNSGFMYVQNKKRWYVEHRNGTGHTPWSRIVYSNFYLNGKEIPSNLFVHHKDENTENDSPENLSLMSVKDHVTLHIGRIIVLEKNDERHEFPTSIQAGIFLGLLKGACHTAIRKKRKIKGWNVSYKSKNNQKEI